MFHDVSYQFLQAPGQARRVGARGGKATARNRRERHDDAAAEIAEPLASEAEPPVHLDTTVAAMALLDAQHPWLRAPRGGPTVRLAPAADGVPSG